MAAKLPDSIIQVSISRFPPKGYKGYKFSKLAPPAELLLDYKKTGDTKAYVKTYKETVLAKLDAKDLYNKFEEYFGGKDICLLCFEKPDSFCHRHIVSEWFQEAGLPSREWAKEDSDQNQMSLF